MPLDDSEVRIDPDDIGYIRAARDPENLPSPHGDLPDWFTDMDHQILHVMAFGHILTPAIIAENIDRSRGAVSRRLQTLSAGDFIEKVERGKYSITKKGAFTVIGDPAIFKSENGSTQTE